VTRRVRHRRGDQRGLAAPVAVTVVGMVLLTTVLSASLGRVLVDQRRAAAAADLAALAAAAAVQTGSDACSAAAVTADRNSARLVTCEVQEDRVRVVTEVLSTVLTGRAVSVRGVAVGGPVEGPVGEPVS